MQSTQTTHWIPTGGAFQWSYLIVWIREWCIQLWFKHLMIPTNHSILLFHIHFVPAFRFPESTLHPPLWGSSHLLQPHLCLWRDVEQLRAMTPSVSLSNNRMEWILFLIHQDERLTEHILYVELESRTCSHGVLRKCWITASMLLQRMFTQQHGEIYCQNRSAWRSAKEPWHLKSAESMQQRSGEVALPEEIHGEDWP